MNKNKGFTLLETLIVLGLVSLMFGFGAVQLRQVAAASQERHFWQSLRQNWQASQVRARGNDKGTDINYLPSRRAIRFSWTDQHIIPRHNDVVIPKTIQVISFAKLKMLPNGYVKARTQKFRSNLTNQNYDMKIQLAWGGFYVEIEK
ncbi:prepilin-type N-terminal cleavage/methylation domain-containing protein [Paucilactobacillus kaifaensis]|uniref:prepilin-type N-terminal cleavage/methylation domain-containing protein n=1 Tax=Paucilactobacillus kaifaensis TaxID=2559921 RepID=UPI0010F90261|nr:prepilin-type N-terminal cleavage/methylation domain-containing protein [Paucilactobacillus kaifaensis]